MRTFLAILLSFTLMGIISGLFSMAGLLLGFGFWVVFLIVTAVQLVVGALFNTYIDNKTSLDRQSIISANRLADSLQRTDLLCAYCSTKNSVEISIAKENSFECTNCNSTNKIQMTFTTTRITEPVVRDKVLSEVFSKMQDAPDRQSTDPINDSKDKIEISGGTNE